VLLDAFVYEHNWMDTIKKHLLFVHFSLKTKDHPWKVSTQPRFQSIFQGAFTFKVNINKNTMPSHTSPPPLYIYLVNMNNADAT